MYILCIALYKIILYHTFMKRKILPIRFSDTEREEIHSAMTKYGFTESAPFIRFLVKREVLKKTPTD